MQPDKDVAFAQLVKVIQDETFQVLDVANLRLGHLE
jgi:hypothetical protein